VNKITQIADYTGLAENYRKYRQGYSENVLTQLINHTKMLAKRSLLVDVGAGTGIWTRQVSERGIICTAVEPNEAMMSQGVLYTADLPITWMTGTAEETDLENNFADWVTMASSFHWTNPARSLPEFHRILKKEGYLTLLWNPLVKKGDALQETVESIIKREVPDFSRGEREQEDYGLLLEQSGYFKNIYELREQHAVTMPVLMYLNTWRAVHHLQTVAGQERFEKVMYEITNVLKEKETITVPYLTKSWTAKKNNETNT